jgi:hypothetical protein
MKLGVDIAVVNEMGIWGNGFEGDSEYDDVSFSQLRGQSWMV